MLIFYLFAYIVLSFQYEGIFLLKITISDKVYR